MDKYSRYTSALRVITAKSGELLQFWNTLVVKHVDTIQSRFCCTQFYRQEEIMKEVKAGDWHDIAFRLSG